MAAPTWKAASRLCGTSVHWFAGVNVGKLEASAEEALLFIQSRQDSEAVLDRLRRVKVLILDEVSMLCPQCLIILSSSAVWYVIQKLFSGGCAASSPGDFMQIPPVASRTLAFEARCWKALFAEPQQQQTLLRQHRQSEGEFYNFLKRLRYGYLHETDIGLLLAASRREGASEWLSMFATNEDVEKVNASRLRRLEGEAVSFDAQDDFHPDVTVQSRKELEVGLDEQCPRQLVLKVGAPVRLTHVQNSEATSQRNGGQSDRFRGQGAYCAAGWRRWHTDSRATHRCLHPIRGRGTTARSEEASPIGPRVGHHLAQSARDDAHACGDACEQSVPREYGLRSFEPGLESQRLEVD